jgi:hypothetical protein
LHDVDEFSVPRFYSDPVHGCGTAGDFKAWRISKIKPPFPVSSVKIIIP